MYRAIRKLGIPDSNIILMLPDDIACNTRNKYPGSVYAHKDHRLDLYGERVEVDYRGYEVTVENFLRVLTGRHTEDTPASRRLLSDENSNVLLYLTGHGGDEFLKFQDTEELNSQDIADAIEHMRVKKRYNKMLFISDTCQAATLANRLYSPDVLAIGSSLKGQNSYSHHTDREIGVGVIEGFTHFTLNALSDIDSNSNSTLADFIDSFDKKQIKSTPGVRDDLFGDLSETLLTDFFAGNIKVDVLPPDVKHELVVGESVDKIDDIENDKVQEDKTTVKETKEMHILDNLNYSHIFALLFILSLIIHHL
ncbi:hypothetical protein WALSEDRAFT_59474 [Wallemia mellicola CBS 633.66]|nr:hypothetical protein WALSEDRAFT_59474 [Wallemia mellicola CBS 633.66]EIM23170.1 hypothetical protein WALSEDRAFT_59474 [Wallemia mellicola CBS 633.66]|eukprot:XP_006956566.1 hypothetical protein WALSEDRAFT_59474 [Wallemia mellicola CBS 633.66]